MGKAAGSGFIKAFDAGMKGQSQLINGVAATILGGSGTRAQQSGFQAGTAAGKGFYDGWELQELGGAQGNTLFFLPKDYQQQARVAGRKAAGEFIKGIPAGGLTIGQPGYPKPYTGSQMPAGVTGSQLINGVAATILPGQGLRGPRTAHSGMHETLRKDTLIQARRNERVDISPPGGDNPGRTSGLDERALYEIVQLLRRILGTRL